MYLIPFDTFDTLKLNNIVNGLITPLVITFMETVNIWEKKTAASKAKLGMKYALRAFIF